MVRLPGTSIFTLGIFLYTSLDTQQKRTIAQWEIETKKMGVEDYTKYSFEPKEFKLGGKMLRKKSEGEVIKVLGRV